MASDPRGRVSSGATPGHGGRSAVASSASTGCMSGETHQFVPGSSHDNHLVSPPYGSRRGLPPDRRTWSTTRSGTCPTSGPSTREALLPLLRHRRLPLAPPVPGGVDRALSRGASTAAGTSGGRRPFARQLALGGCCPRGPSSRPARTGCRRGTRCPPTSARLYARYMEAFAGFLSHTDARDRPPRRLPRRTGDLDNTVLFVLSDNGASSEGGPTGSVNDVRPWNGRRPRSGRGGLGADRRDRRTPLPRQLPLGMDGRRQHTVPALEARGARGRGGRPADRPLAGGRPRGGSFRNQYVHAVDVMPTVLEGSGSRRREPWPACPRRRCRGPVLAALGRARGPRHHHCSTTRCSASRALYQEGWKAVTYHPIRTARRRWSHAPSPRTRGSSTTWPWTPRSATTWPGGEPDAWPQMVERWWIEAGRYGVLPLDTAPFSDLVFGRPRAVPGRRRYDVLPGSGGRPRARGRHVDLQRDPRIVWPPSRHATGRGGTGRGRGEGCLALRSAPRRWTLASTTNPPAAPSFIP